MKRKLITVLLIVFASGLINAQQSQEELSVAAANPLADLMSFPFQNNLNMNYGPYNRLFHLPMDISLPVPFFRSFEFRILAMKVENFLRDWLILYLLHFMFLKVKEQCGD